MKRQHQTTKTSSPVISTQMRVHRKLSATVEKHLERPSQRPITPHTALAFQKVEERLAAHKGGLIFDSFCGTGSSTAVLAQRYPGALVVGIDKSAHRLRKHQAGGHQNYLLVQADCGDFWRSALAAGCQLAHHFIFYPNPWPKPSQLQRRVHGSPEFSDLLALGGQLELRSNWPIYVEEFGVALNISGNAPIVARVEPANPISLHERKYLQSGHPLWRCRSNLSQNVGSAPSKTRRENNDGHR